MTQAASHRPLEGIRVLELGELIAGAFIGTLLVLLSVRRETGKE